jgi:uncharacterized Zn finger protein (UPF0148 family)
MRDFRDYDLYEAMQMKKEMEAPHCDKCGQPIFDDYLWDFKGDIYCEECAEDAFKRSTDNYYND